MSYHTKFDGVLTTLPRVINSNIKVFLRCARIVNRDNIILLVGSGIKNFLSLVSLSKIPLSRDFVSTYIFVLSVALRTSLYGALKELMSPAVLMIIIVMYYRL